MGGSETSGFQAYFVVDITCIKQPSHILNIASLHIHAYLSSPPNSGRILEATVWYGCETSCCIQFYYYRCKITTVEPSCQCQEGPEVEWLRSGEYSDWGTVRILLIAKNCCIARVLSQDVWYRFYMYMLPWEIFFQNSQKWSFCDANFFSCLFSC